MANQDTLDEMANQDTLDEMASVPNAREEWTDREENGLLTERVGDPRYKHSTGPHSGKPAWKRIASGTLEDGSSEGPIGARNAAS
eukprot:2974546-Prymnesium_polylepis.1